MSHFYAFCAGWFGAFLIMAVADGRVPLFIICCVSIALLSLWSRLAA